jgi:hypothetical protein
MREESSRSSGAQQHAKRKRDCDCGLELTCLFGVRHEEMRRNKNGKVERKVEESHYDFHVDVDFLLFFFSSSLFVSRVARVAHVRLVSGVEGEICRLVLLFRTLLGCCYCRHPLTSSLICFDDIARVGLLSPLRYHLLQRQEGQA